MLTLRSIGIAITMLCSLFLFGMVNNSDAQIEIIDMNTPSETDNNGYFYHVVSIETDKPFDAVDWSIGDSDSVWNLSYRSTIWGDGVKTRAWFYPDGTDCPGDIKGTKYRVGARVWYTDDDGNSWADYETRVFKVYSPIIDSGIKKTTKEGAEIAGILRVTGANGHAELSRHYFNGSFIGISGYISAYNGTDNVLTGSGRFRHALMNKPADELEKDLPNDPIKSGKYYGTYYTSDYGTFFEYPTGGNILRDDRWECEAYIRLVVSDGLVMDTWLATTTSTFTYEDNP